MLGAENPKSEKWTQHHCKVAYQQDSALEKQDWKSSGEIPSDHLVSHSFQDFASAWETLRQKNQTACISVAS